MEGLRVTEEWLTWFQKKRIELVTTYDTKELMQISVERKFEGERTSYGSILAVITTLRDFFGWLDISKIRLEFSDEIDRSDLQFYNGGDYNSWRDQVLRNFVSISPVKDDVVEDSSHIYYNYRLNVNGVSSLLYCYGEMDVITFFTYYDDGNDTTIFTINAELRKNLFVVDKEFEANLPQEYLDHNSKLLQLTIDKMKDCGC